MVELREIQCVVSVGSRFRTSANRSSVFTPSGASRSCLKNYAILVSMPTELTWVPTQCSNLFTHDLNLKPSLTTSLFNLSTKFMLFRNDNTIFFVSEPAELFRASTTLLILLTVCHAASVISFVYFCLLCCSWIFFKIIAMVNMFSLISAILTTTESPSTGTPSKL